MTTVHLTAKEFAMAMTDRVRRERLGRPAAIGGGTVIVVDSTESAAPNLEATLALPAVIVAVGRTTDSEPEREAPAWCDVSVAGHDDIAALEAGVAANPAASIALALHLRHAPRNVLDGLVAESTLYSLLQAGPEFRAWLEATEDREPQPVDVPVLSERRGPQLDVRLNSPNRHNALSMHMRDAIVEALDVALVDRTIERIVLGGVGPSFCSGGDLDTFGRTIDPVSAHHVRLLRSPARSLSRLSDRLTVELHGVAAGGGIELAAFASHVRATPDTTIWLPEVGFGLIPGAGGTVSVPARIGRHRTLWLAITQTRIDAATAQRWGLVDEVAERNVS